MLDSSVAAVGSHPSLPQAPLLIFSLVEPVCKVNCFHPPKSQDNAAKGEINAGIHGIVLLAAKIASADIRKKFSSRDLLPNTFFM